MKGIRYYINSEYDSIIELKVCNSYLHSSKSHLHDEISIGLVECGSCTLEVYNKNHFINEKSILIIPAGIIHKCNPTTLDNWSFRMLYINKEWVKKNFEIDITEKDFKYRVLKLIEYENFKKVFSEIGKSKNIVEEEYNLFEIMSQTIWSKENHELIENKNKYMINIEKIKNYIDEFYLKNIALKELSEISGLSKFYLIRKFEEMYGISPHKYINSKKIAYAKSILKKNISIAEVAIESGFYDQSHFNKIFKEYSGITPKKYLKDIGK